MTQENKELGVLYKISQTISARQHNISDLLNEVLQIMSNDMGLLRGTLTLRKPGTDILNIEASSGLSSSEMRRGQYKLGEGVTGSVGQTGKPFIVPDISESPDFLNRTKARSDQKVAFICVPIIHHKEVIGTMSIDLPTCEEAELKGYALFLEHVAQILASAVSTIREEIEERHALESENEMLRRQLGDRYSIDNMVGNCNSMRSVYEQIVQVANSAATVLVRGESGTGKELVARAIHFNSPRKNNAFVSVNCAALPENLIESELFGHEKGAFTGAAQQRKGRFELANGGTIFLDEIGDFSPAMQVKLLRVLQERTYERVGSNEQRSANVRIITATNADLEAAILDNRFRQDLFYRINVFPIHLPPLRSRKDDILLLTNFFLKKYATQMDAEIRRISTPAINMLMAYHWPGNVRELENTIEYAVLMGKEDGVVHGHDLPPTLQTPVAISATGNNKHTLKARVAMLERDLIVDSLKRQNGTISAAARELGITERMVRYKIQNLDIDYETLFKKRRRRKS